MQQIVDNDECLQRLVEKKATVTHGDRQSSALKRLCISKISTQRTTIQTRVFPKVYLKMLPVLGISNHCQHNEDVSKLHIDNQSLDRILQFLPIIAAVPRCHRLPLQNRPLPRCRHGRASTNRTLSSRIKTPITTSRRPKTIRRGHVCRRTLCHIFRGS